MWINGKKATQPCPCGYAGDPSGQCHCSGEQIQRYRARISGPLLDRIDLQIEVPRPPARTLADLEATETIGQSHLAEAISYRMPGSGHIQY